MSVTWIEYREKKILFIDVSNLMSNYGALRAELGSLVSVLQNEPAHSVLVLADLRGTHLNNNSLQALMSNAPLVAPYFRRSALVIEPNNARRIVLDSLGHFIGHLPRRFEDLEAAKEWLASDES